MEEGEGKVVSSYIYKFKVYLDYYDDCKQKIFRLMLGMHSLTFETGWVSIPIITNLNV